MNERKGILAIIPARVGSKGLPGKNVRPLHGRPLISWTIDAAKASKYINRIIVSTDDQKAADICGNCGVEIPFLRPKELAQDDTPIIDVIIHILENLNNTENYVPDIVVLLQPTSPLRTSADIDKALELLLGNKNAEAVVSISEVSETPYWMRVLDKDGFIKYFMEHDYKDFRRQDLPPVYVVNGAIYICRKTALIKNRSFSPNNTLGYLMPKSRSVDIDDITDFELAESIMSKQVKEIQ